MIDFFNDIISATIKNYVPELIISILSSGMPMLYFYYNTKDIEQLNNSIKNNLTSEEMFKYIGYFALAFIFIAVIRHLYRTDFMKKIYNIIHSISSGLINVYRLASGVLITFPIIWYLGEPETLTIERTLFFIFFGLGSAFVSSVFLSVHERVDSVFEIRAKQ